MTNFELTQAFQYSATQVYEMLTNMEAYPQYMKNIDRVTVIDRQADRTKTQWEAVLDGKKIVWTEDDVFDRSARTISYRLLEGDLSDMSGSWQVRETEAGSEVAISVSFSFGIPMMAMFVEPILKRKLEENCKMLLAGINTELGKN